MINHEVHDHFSLTFGRVPENYIHRTAAETEIYELLQVALPEAHACFITGMRGSGKTVLMTYAENVLRQQENWIVVDLNPERNMQKTILAELSTCLWNGSVGKNLCPLNLSGIMRKKEQHLKF